MTVGMPLPTLLADDATILNNNHVNINQNLGLINTSTTSYFNQFDRQLSQGFSNPGNKTSLASRVCQSSGQTNNQEDPYVSMKSKPNNQLVPWTTFHNDPLSAIDGAVESLFDMNVPFGSKVSCTSDEDTYVKTNVNNVTTSG